MDVHVQGCATRYVLKMYVSEDAQKTRNAVSVHFALRVSVEPLKLVKTQKIAT